MWKKYKKRIVASCEKNEICNVLYDITFAVLLQKANWPDAIMSQILKTNITLQRHNYVIHGTLTVLPCFLIAFVGCLFHMKE